MANNVPSDLWRVLDFNEIAARETAKNRIEEHYARLITHTKHKKTKIQ